MNMLGGPSSSSVVRSVNFPIFRLLASSFTFSPLFSTTGLHVG